jgi:hypothetical protein
MLKLLIVDCFKYLSCSVLLPLKGNGAEQSTRSASKTKGASSSRKPQNLLTPGTVKYAAFHVLSVQGSSGLPITEIADRIEVSYI